VASYQGYDSRNPLSPNVKDLIPALKSLSEVNGTQAGADSFAAHFDIDQVFISMAFEYLAENWDAYWANSRNYALYFDVRLQSFFSATPTYTQILPPARHAQVVLHSPRLRLRFRAIQPGVDRVTYLLGAQNETDPSIQ